MERIIGFCHFYHFRLFSWFSWFSWFRPLFVIFLIFLLLVISWLIGSEGTLSVRASGGFAPRKWNFRKVGNHGKWEITENEKSRKLGKVENAIRLTGRRGHGLLACLWAFPGAARTVHGGQWCARWYPGMVGTGHGADWTWCPWYPSGSPPILHWHHGQPSHSGHHSQPSQPGIHCQPVSQTPSSQTARFQPNPGGQKESKKWSLFWPKNGRWGGQFLTFLTKIPSLPRGLLVKMTKMAENGRKWQILVRQRKSGFLRRGTCGFWHFWHFWPLLNQFLTILDLFWPLFILSQPILAVPNWPAERLTFSKSGQNVTNNWFLALFGPILDTFWPILAIFSTHLKTESLP